ncbi:MAG: UDP-N-acetylglucosamine 1-carboxyvinyltransferase [Candidatus Pacebacteria bacterium]|nr:UDP-N-acetylglucosamine 1-carboxyvinyltransferase [Candidatus Paceibacterota bacterium]NUQ57623.1 UDP-N-acetylglucosamine 1-carboxyvinyltransferase [Candidatus Paceibacter sp.]
MSDYVISGGRKLKGEITVNPSKNSAVAILLASLLNEGKTTIMNLPKIEEVFRIIEILESLGAKTKWLKDHIFEITPPKKINLKNLNTEAALKTRIMILLIGILAHKFEKFSLPFSGGCKLGKRTVTPHLYALENFGIKIKVKEGEYEISRKKITPGGEVIMYESGDTATENAILAASLAPGKTTIKFASANYQVQDLCHFLAELGAKIEGIGATTLEIMGAEKMDKNINFYLTEDPIDAMFFLTAAIVTKSFLTVKKCPLDFLELELFKLKKMGLKFSVSKEYLSENGFARLADVKVSPSKLEAPAEKLYGRPFPGLNIDNLPFFVPVAALAEGETLVHDWVYENRAIYYTELNRLGAKINLADAHRVFVKGPTEFKAAEVVCLPALRPSAIILIAMLGAKGRSVLKNTYTIERGYEDICGRLRSIGAEIEKVATSH